MAEVEVCCVESVGLSEGVESVVRRVVELGCDLDAVTEVVVDKILPCQSFGGDVVEAVREGIVALGFEVEEATLDDVPEVGVLYVGTGRNAALAEELAAAFREIP